MIRKLIAASALAGSLTLAACAPTTLFEWGSYEQSLYAYAKNPENREGYKTSLTNAIAQGQKRNAVAPGLYAELGYLYLEENNAALAVEQFQKERDLFPESARFMDRIIGQLTNSNAAAAGQN